MQKVRDGHIHIYHPDYDKTIFMQRLNDSGISGGIIISPRPASFTAVQPGIKLSNRERLDNLLACCQANQELIPFYWIDPLESDYEAQIEQAAAAGVGGFKIICNRFMPDHPQAIKCYHLIAECNRPILFHSGILWNGVASANYNRPGNFEALLQIPKLRFSLAHISWPWVDELIAVYGKFQHALQHNPRISCEMFIDTTPGTPPIYRREALTKLFTVGYKVEDNIFFGTEGSVENYSVDWATEWLKRDRQIMEELQIPNDVINKVFGGNLQRFITGG